MEIIRKGNQAIICFRDLPDGAVWKHPGGDEIYMKLAENPRLGKYRSLNLENGILLHTSDEGEIIVLKAKLIIGEAENE